MFCYTENPNHKAATFHSEIGSKQKTKFSSPVPVALSSSYQTLSSTVKREQWNTVEGWIESATTVKVLIVCQKEDPRVNTGASLPTKMTSTPSAPTKLHTSSAKENVALQRVKFTGRDMLNLERDSAELQYSDTYETLKAIVRHEKALAEKRQTIAKRQTALAKIQDDLSGELWQMENEDWHLGTEAYDLHLQKQRTKERLNLLLRTHQELSQKLGTTRDLLWNPDSLENLTPTSLRPKRHSKSRHRSPVGSPMRPLNLGRRDLDASSSLETLALERLPGQDLSGDICFGEETYQSPIGTTRQSTL